MTRRQALDSFSLSPAPARPLVIAWASGILVLAGGLYLLPIVFTLLANLAQFSSIRPSLLLALAVAGVLSGANFVLAWAGWHGKSWARFGSLAMVVGELAFLVAGYDAASLGLVLVGIAAVLLWRPHSRTFSTTMSPRRNGRRPPT